MNWLRSWILGLAAAALLCAVCLELTPKGAVKSVQRFLCALVMTLSLISPLLRLQGANYALALARYRSLAQSITARTEEISRSFSRTYIEEECRAYILDKAQELALELHDAVVTLRWSGEGFWYPVRVQLEGDYHPALSQIIEADLGLGRKEQQWNGDEGT